MPWLTDTSHDHAEPMNEHPRHATDDERIRVSIKKLVLSLPIEGANEIVFITLSDGTRFVTGADALQSFGRFDNHVRATETEYGDALMLCPSTPGRRRPTEWRRHLASIFERNHSQNDPEKPIGILRRFIRLIRATLSSRAAGPS